MGLDFNNTEVAFRSQSDFDLRQSFLLFKMIGVPLLAKAGPKLTNFALQWHLPIQGLIKKTIFQHFCGGESIEDCLVTMQNLARFHIGTILDYSVEGAESEAAFDATGAEILHTIQTASVHKKNIPFCVFKMTGLGRFSLFEKMDRGEALSYPESQEFQRTKQRIVHICQKAFNHGVRLLIDAEETWIQTVIDNITNEMMERFNKSAPIIFNTFQMYRVGGIKSLENSLQRADSMGYQLGAKIVRGAYMEKERARAAALNRPSPILRDKKATDAAYNAALEFSIAHLDRIAICAGTHNEESCHKLASLMAENGINPSNDRVFFSQLLGMGDHLSYNLAEAGYNVAKYVPYGPVKATLPYLFRRAAENTSVQGQTSRELRLISAELSRRKRLQTN